MAFPGMRASGGAGEFGACIVVACGMVVERPESILKRFWPPERIKTRCHSGSAQNDV